MTRRAAALKNKQTDFRPHRLPSCFSFSSHHSSLDRFFCCPWQQWIIKKKTKKKAKCFNQSVSFRVKYSRWRDFRFGFELLSPWTNAVVLVPVADRTGWGWCCCCCCCKCRTPPATVVPRPVAIIATGGRTLVAKFCLLRQLVAEPVFFFFIWFVFFAPLSQHDLKFFATLPVLQTINTQGDATTRFSFLLCFAGDTAKAAFWFLQPNWKEALWIFTMTPPAFILTGTVCLALTSSVGVRHKLPDFNVFLEKKRVWLLPG